MTSMKIETQLSLLAKLGSIAVHADEFLSNEGHFFDVRAIEGLIKDPEVKKFLKQMQKMAMVPVNRKK